MSQDVEYTWTETEKFWILNYKNSNKPNNNWCVFKKAGQKGYLFVVGKKCSYAATIEDAKNWVETIVEFGRWPQ